MESALPIFQYYPDPLSNGSVVESDDQCRCCHRSRGFVYDGPASMVDEVRPVCPWCIADGTAADELDAQFTDVFDAPDEVPDAILEVVARRTPGFRGWQQERWLFHCSDAAQYLGRAWHSDAASDERIA